MLTPDPRNKLTMRRSWTEGGWAQTDRFRGTQQTVSGVPNRPFQGHPTDRFRGTQQTVSGVPNRPFQGHPTDRFRGTQQTVSVNIRWDHLLLPSIFGLKCDEKWSTFLAQIFMIWGNTCCFRTCPRDKNVPKCGLGTKKDHAAGTFGKATAARKFV